jgi:hypothetical protein
MLNSCGANAPNVSVVVGGKKFRIYHAGQRLSDGWRTSRSMNIRRADLLSTVAATTAARTR